MTDFEMGPDLRIGRSTGDGAVLEHCLDLIRNERTFESYGQTQGWALEFGVGNGYSLRTIAAVLPVIGFDSFEGLPEDWRPNHLKGHFGEAKIPSNIVGATIVPGWFKDTVLNYDWPENIALIHMDADLYSSTITVLDALPRLEPGTIVVFDEFFGYDDDFHGTMPGEQQAWWEYTSVYPYEYDVIGHGREQWAIKITKVLDR